MGNLGEYPKQDISYKDCPEPTAIEAFTGGLVLVALAVVSIGICVIVSPFVSYAGQRTECWLYPNTDKCIEFRHHTGLE